MTSLGRHKRAHRQNCLHRRRATRGRNESKRGDDASYKRTQSRVPPRSGELPSPFCLGAVYISEDTVRSTNLKFLTFAREEIYTARTGSFCASGCPSSCNDRERAIKLPACPVVSPSRSHTPSASSACWIPSPRRPRTRFASDSSLNERATPWDFPPPSRGLGRA